MSLLRAYLLDRMMRGSRGRHGRYRGYGRGYGRRGRRSGGDFRIFPFPHYSRRTRGGGRVSVGGCCLPIPLALTIGAVAGAGRLLRR
jgi:hypothetical protein